MNIGIVTVQDSNNFGSFLQAYALQYVLQNWGHKVSFVRTRSKKYIRSLFYKNKPVKLDLIHPKQYILNNINGRKKYKLFKKEQKVFTVIDDYKDSLFDVVILGSDEIWNVKTKVFQKDIFYGANMKNVMTYAVSIGDASLEDMTYISPNHFKHIHPLLVRDEHTSDFLTNIGLNSTIVCDPTLLVDKSIFFRKYDNPLLEEHPYILVYSYGLEKEIAQAICEFAKKKNLKVYSTCFHFDWCDGMIDCAALDFCAIIEKAKYVFTSTFHGTIFSIINHKQFISLPKSRKTSDLLSVFDLSNRILYNEECSFTLFENKWENEKINYNEVDKKIFKIRKKSLEYLKVGLSTYEV